MKKLLLLSFGASWILTALTIAQYTSKCPYVDERTGLECMGVPMPNGVSPAGMKYRCTLNSGHTWVEKN